MDREKVKKGLECLARKQEPMANPCSKCDYHDRPNFAFCVVDVATDALELLKEQENDIHHMGLIIDEYEKELKKQEAEWIEYPKCLAYDGAYSDSHIVCSACWHVFSIIDNCTEEFDYCPHCGAKMEGIKPTKTNAKSNSLDVR